ncbi:hypothetical protein Tco_0025484 [Tanacetum coccineum]
MKELNKCIFNGPYVMTRVLVLAKPARKTDPPVPEHTVQETYENILPENHAYIGAEAEAIHMILSEIGNEIYSIVDACKTAQEIFVTVVKQTIYLDKESYHKLFEIIKQYQNKVNELRAKKITKNANPFALVASTQHYPNDNYYHVPKPHKNQTTTSRHTSSTSSHAPTRNKGKEVAKPITPPSSSASKDDSDPGQAQRYKNMQKSIALIAKYFIKIYKPTNNNLRTSSNSRNRNVDSNPRTRNDKQTGQFGYQRTITVVEARETVGNQDTDEDPDEQDLEAHYMYMAKIQEVLHVTDDNFGPTYDTEPLEQNADDNDEDERVELANLIANLKFDIDENKKIQKDRCRIALHQKEVELEKYTTCKNYQLEKEEIKQVEDGGLALFGEWGGEVLGKRGGE